MADMDTIYGVYRLFGGGDEAKWETIKGQLDVGRDLLSLGGAVIERVVLAEGETRTVNTTGFAAVSGVALPPITYLGRPIELYVSCGQLTHSAADVACNFRVFDTTSGRTLISTPLDGLRSPATAGQRFTREFETVVPVPGVWDIPVGTVITPRLEAATASGTLTMGSYFNNLILGTVPIEIRATQR